MAFGDFTRQSWVFASNEEDDAHELMMPSKKSYGPPTTGRRFTRAQM